MKLLSVFFLSFITFTSFAQTPDELCTKLSQDGRKIVSLESNLTETRKDSVILDFTLSEYVCQNREAIKIDIEDDLAKVYISDASTEIDTYKVRPKKVFVASVEKSVRVKAIFDRNFIYDEQKLNFIVGHGLKRDYGLNFELDLKLNSDAYETTITGATPIITPKGIAKGALSFAIGYGIGLVLL